MYEKSRAIVLRIHKLDDEKRIAEVYTECRGFLSFRISQGGGKRSKMKSTYFLPLNLLELEYDYRERFPLQTINELSLLSSMQMSSFNPYKSAIILFLSEFLVNILRKEPKNEELFTFLVDSFEWLERSDTDFPSFHLALVTQITRFLGIPPFMDSYVPGYYFDMQESSFVEMPPVHGVFLAPEYATLLAAMYRVPYEDMHLLELSRQDRREYLKILIHYYQLHFPGFTDMKSLTVLSDLFE